MVTNIGQKLVNKLIEDVGEMIEITDSYFNLIKEYLYGHDPLLYKNIDDKIKNSKIQLSTISDLVKNIVRGGAGKPTGGKTTSGKTTSGGVTVVSSSPVSIVLQTNTQLYDALDTLDGYLSVFYDMFQNDKFMKLVVLNMSHTYAVTINLNKERFSNIYSNYQHFDHSQYLKSQLNDISPKGPTSADVLHLIIQFIINCGSINIFIVELIRENIKYAKGSTYEGLIKLIETQKDKLFNVKRMDLLTKYKGAQSFIVRHGLVPCTKSQPLNELLKTMQGVTRKEPISSTTAPAPLTIFCASE